MSSSANVQAPSGLLADIKHRTDGSHRMFGIHLRWQIGGNRPDHGTWPPPEDWNDGNAPYPHVYEVWINGAARQTVILYWPAWDWSPSNSHWVDLGEEPDAEYRVKIRAKVDGSFTAFTNEVTVTPDSAVPWSTAPQKTEGARSGVDASPRHGTVDHPRSRAAAVIRDEDPSPICAKARAENTSTTWQEVVPGKDRMLADYPWNHALHYLEYRKFFQGSTVASTGNPAFAGLDLAPVRTSATGPRPVWTPAPKGTRSRTTTWPITRTRPGRTAGSSPAKAGTPAADSRGRTWSPFRSWWRSRGPRGRRTPPIGSSPPSRPEAGGPRSWTSGAVMAARTPLTAATGARPASSSSPCATWNSTDAFRIRVTVEGARTSG